jgi:hypothetical protein
VSDTLLEVKRRCEEAGYVVWGGESGLRVIDPRFENRTFSDDHAIWINPDLGAEVALRSGFEKYWLMDRSYPAIWSPRFGAVECELRSVRSKAIKSDLGEEELLHVVLAMFGKYPQAMSPENRINIPSVGGTRITIQRRA